MTIQEEAQKALDETLRTVKVCEAKRILKAIQNSQANIKELQKELAKVDKLVLVEGITMTTDRMTLGD